ncbi:hypothetical protein QJS10_CPB20g00068 [Acorus calamus]|uniref:Uncharacterized protein n=1 Tax=Acorus calamus TaxID=4465 RepID=A0AAV9C8V2_ACOCL|nr:hypothetical protein QJS10_CPB20g00068 [Acorus calamus]
MLQISIRSDATTKNRGIWNREMQILHEVQSADSTTNANPLPRVWILHKTTRGSERNGQTGITKPTNGNKVHA